MNEKTICSGGYRDCGYGDYKMKAGKAHDFNRGKCQLEYGTLLGLTVGIFLVYDMCKAKARAF